MADQIEFFYSNLITNFYNFPPRNQTIDNNRSLLNEDSLANYSSISLNNSLISDNNLSCKSTNNFNSNSAFYNRNISYGNINNNKNNNASKTKMENNDKNMINYNINNNNDITSLNLNDERNNNEKEINMKNQKAIKNQIKGNIDNVLFDEVFDSKNPNFDIEAHLNNSSISNNNNNVLTRSLSSPNVNKVMVFPSMGYAVEELIGRMGMKKGGGGEVVMEGNSNKERIDIMNYLMGMFFLIICFFSFKFLSIFYNYLIFLFFKATNYPETLKTKRINLSFKNNTILSFIKADQNIMKVILRNMSGKFAWSIKLFDLIGFDFNQTKYDNKKIDIFLHPQAISQQIITLSGRDRSSTFFYKEDEAFIKKGGAEKEDKERKKEEQKRKGGGKKEELMEKKEDKIGSGKKGEECGRKETGGWIKDGRGWKKEEGKKEQAEITKDEIKKQTEERKREEGREEIKREEKKKEKEEKEVSGGKKEEVTRVELKREDFGSFLAQIRGRIEGFDEFNKNHDMGGEIKEFQKMWKQKERMLADAEFNFIKKQLGF